MTIANLKKLFKTKATDRNWLYIDGTVQSEFGITLLSSEEALFRLGNGIMQIAFSQNLFKKIQEDYHLHMCDNYVLWQNEAVQEMLELLDEYDIKCLAERSLKSKIGIQKLKNSTEEILKYQRDLNSITVTEADVVSKVRKGQNKLRDYLIDIYGGCVVTGIQNASLLIASHIVPWHLGQNCRLDLDNVLLLAKNIDALFDSHLISFSPESGNIIKSNRLNQNEFLCFGLNISMKIPVPNSRQAVFLQQHLNTMRDKDIRASK